MNPKLKRNIVSLAMVTISYLCVMADVPLVLALVLVAMFAVALTICLDFWDGFGDGP